ncbi:DUF1501 domain-containing protein [Marinoscillum furvescens]|uniref:Putative secreted protein (Por secretion system target) n=1 Tax=Marinoscillum furvescens DSM 4134 TaxID=1122208 RepID=A0A3D9L7G4_MARFU|nr:DUF1501 domain-containing protein [Marinoscillum furvescens]REE01288.1 putative secreted protein (Por secretion system target) [Marinoscillum furvescens DSM 4134]
MRRRSFLRHVTHSLAVPGVLGSMGFRMPGPNSLPSLLRMAADQDRVLVLVFLEGGNDGLNTVVPLDQLSVLNKLRPHVILPEERLHRLPDADIGLHPALGGLKSLYNENRLQVIQNVGYPAQNYSHFRSTDIWMSGSDSDELINSGWTGRYLADEFPGYPEAFPNDDMADPLSIEMGYGSSLLFQGPQSTMSMVIGDPNSFYELVDNEEPEVPDTLAGDKLRYIRLIAKQSQQYGEVVTAAAHKVKKQQDFPQTYIGQQLQIVSRLIAGGLRTPLYLVRLGGFDTHDAQVEEGDHTTGEHNELLTQLDEAVMAFMKDLEYQGTDDKVLGMTFSEFGRRIVSNASLGTDHGAAAPMFFFGNAVKGGVVGNNPQLSSSMSYDDNLPWEFDFRQLYGSVMDQWLGASNDRIQNALFDTYDPVEIIGNRARLLAGQKPETRGIIVYPNPLNGHATIRVSATQEPVAIQLIDLQGRRLETMYTGVIAGEQSFQWDTHRLPRGKYFVTVTGQNTRRVFPVVK